MSITFAYYRLARSTNGAKLTLCCFSHFWTAAQKYAFNLWPENKTKNSHNELKIAYFHTRLKKKERLIQKLVPRVAKVTNVH